MDIYRRTVELLQTKLRIPPDYVVLFVSSATESWEIIAQSLTIEQSFHVYNGAFGQKWMEYARKLRPQVSGVSFGLEEELLVETLPVPSQTEIICLTQNETSNGTQVQSSMIVELRKRFPDLLLAVDATSSFGGIALPIEEADIWYASVQKCLGLPAGLGLLICSPHAVEKAQAVGENNHYNSLLFLLENAQKFQTSYTPNVLTIYLLMRVLENGETIEQIGIQTKQRAAAWYAFLEKLPGIQPLVINYTVRSDTVITVQAPPEVVKQVKEAALQHNILLGNGYGVWKENTFRIANFPAITEEEIQRLQEFLLVNIS